MIPTSGSASKTSWGISGRRRSTSPVADGQRTVYAVVNLQDAHELPRIAEAFWLALKANVEFIPAMAQDDFARAAPLIEQAAKKYR